MRGLIVAASSQPPDQDLFEAGQLAVDVVQAVTEHHRAWEYRNGPTDWLAATDEIPAEYRAMVDFFTADQSE